MQNSILMKDTQLFLIEVCLCWLALFICPSNLSSEWAGCVRGGTVLGTPWPVED